jgi:hypothetical protein
VYVPRLPRAIEIDPHRAAIEAALARDARPLWPGGTLPVAHVPVEPSFERALAAAQEAHQLARGLEQAEALLASEQKGLDALRERQGTALADRTSRLLVVASDGSERFYRQVERLLLRHADRLLGLRLEAPFEQLALFGREALVRAVLVTDRDGVTDVLRAL